ncbi:hypothetical protein GOODEAATRI_021817, partial [Goodea atripinnis]
MGAKHKASLFTLTQTGPVLAHIRPGQRCSWIRQELTWQLHSTRMTLRRSCSIYRSQPPRGFCLCQKLTRMPSCVSLKEFRPHLLPGTPVQVQSGTKCVDSESSELRVGCSLRSYKLSRRTGPRSASLHKL